MFYNIIFGLECNTFQQIICTVGHRLLIVLEDFPFLTGSAKCAIGTAGKKA
jgi:hypothetical protein